jgi:hypothetical protein
MTFRDVGKRPARAVGRNVIPSYDIPRPGRCHCPKITQLDLEILTYGTGMNRNSRQPQPFISPGSPSQDRAKEF